VERGVFRLAYGATYTKARITIDRLDPTLTGKEPRHQPTWTFSATPEVDLGKSGCRGEPGDDHLQLCDRIATC
jgi:hypothetical protein